MKMGLEIITLSELNQTEKGKQHMLSLRMSNLKKKKKKKMQMYLFTEQKQIYTL